MTKHGVGQAVNWVFIMFGKAFRQGKQEAFETRMLLAVAHVFNCYNPKDFADFLGIPYQQLYVELNTWRVYYLRERLVSFLVNQAVEDLTPVLKKSPATQSRAGITLSVDNSVIDRLGRVLRCTWSWYRGRWKKVVSGQDLLGIVLTLNGKVSPLYRWFCSTQGSADTEKPAQLIAMLPQLKAAFAKTGISLTTMPITLDSWFVSDDVTKQLHHLGLTNVILAGKGNYVLTIGETTQPASAWKKALPLSNTLWGIDVPACRVKAVKPT